MKLRYGILFMAAFGFLFVNSQANAVPSLATKTDKNCSYCHSAWPQLNEKGRAYKNAGYRLPAEVGKKTANFLESGEFPFSAIVVARPYDKKKSGDRKIRALHEVEIIAAVTLGEHFSAFLELEAEDETDFAVEVPHAVLTYSLNEQFNLQVSWGDMFFADPYGLLSDHFRLTRGHVGVIDQQYGGADGALRNPRQNITAYGRIAKRVFYMVGYSGDAKDPEGVGGQNLLGRIAVDVTPNIMVGGFWLEGENAATNRQYRRAGVDFLADVKNFRIAGSYISGKDDTADLLNEVTNNAWSVQAHYFFKTKSGAPTFVPTIRFDRYEKNDGMDKYSEVTFNLAYYVTQYAKVYLEYWDRFDVPTGQSEDNRLTLQAAFAF